MREIKNVVYDKINNLKLDYYLPDSNDFPIVVYAHGGGLESHSYNCEPYIGIGREFAKYGIGFATIEYRTYPSAKFPEYLIDFANAVKFVKEDIKKYTLNKELYISGQSAGAWMTSMLCFNEQYLKNVGIDPLTISGWIIDSAQMTSHFNVIHYEDNLDSRLQVINEYAPLYFVNEKTSFSKILVIYYENDMPARPEQNLLLKATILNFNPKANLKMIMLPGCHCYGSTNMDRYGRYPYVKESIDFIKK